MKEEKRMSLVKMPLYDTKKILGKESGLGPNLYVFADEKDDAKSAKIVDGTMPTDNYPEVYAAKITVNEDIFSNSYMDSPKTYASTPNNYEDSWGTTKVKVEFKDVANYKYKDAGYPPPDYIGEGVDEGVDDAMPGPSKTSGLMVFFINVGQAMSGDAAMDMINTIKKHYQATEEKLKASGVEVMWMPTRNGETDVKFFQFS
jgi:hypothetical protein